MLRNARQRANSRVSVNTLLQSLLGTEFSLELVHKVFGGH